MSTLKKYFDLSYYLLGTTVFFAMQKNLYFKNDKYKLIDILRLQKRPQGFPIYGTFIFFLIKLNVIYEQNVYPFSMRSKTTLRDITKINTEILIHGKIRITRLEQMCCIVVI